MEGRDLLRHRRPKTIPRSARPPMGCRHRERSSVPICAWGFVRRPQHGVGSGIAADVSHGDLIAHARRSSAR